MWFTGTPNKVRTVNSNANNNRCIFGAINNDTESYVSIITPFLCVFTVKYHQKLESLFKSVVQKQRRREQFVQKHCKETVQQQKMWKARQVAILMLLHFAKTRSLTSYDVIFHTLFQDSCSIVLYTTPAQRPLHLPSEASHWMGCRKHFFNI